MYGPIGKMTAKADRPLMAGFSNRVETLPLSGVGRSPAAAIPS
jgi:hypothetical protein